MTQILLNGFDVVAGLDTGNGIRMSQIMEIPPAPPDEKSTSERMCFSYLRTLMLQILVSREKKVGP